MQKLKCELCGSADLHKTADNLFQCQCCGCKYTLEQARRLVQGTVTTKQSDFVIQAGKLVKYCGESTTVEIPTNVSVIGKAAFEECSALRSVLIPDSVTTIESAAFRRCKQLTRINIPESVTSIEAYAFWECTSLSDISIPDGVRIIDFGVFSECSSLREVVLPNNLTKIRSSAFSRCSSLKEIIIPPSVDTIEDEAFYYCSNLEKALISPQTHVHFSAFSYTKWCSIQQEKERKQTQMRKEQNVCLYCGGNFKGIFSPKCVKCGNKKNY